MANCAHCNKVFTCGCQKASLGNGVIVCKQCKAKAEANVSTSRDLNLELAKQQIQDLRKIKISQYHFTHEYHSSYFVV